MARKAAGDFAQTFLAVLMDAFRLAIQSRVVTIGSPAVFVIERPAERVQNPHMAKIDA
ncbi:hypothetical protein [Shimia sp. MIT1388]|uniref:hypothetical protein n=1 Tax=Shimia sp. MIT1388 TaxID=3096992 RepID=UPI003999B353